MSTWEVGPRPWIDVLDAGADPTGKTDSTRALQNALNAAPVGGRILIPQGNFLSGPLTLPFGITVVAYGAVLQENGSGAFLGIPSSTYDNPPTQWFGGTLQAGGNNTSVVRMSSTGAAQGNILLQDMVIDGMSFTGTVGLNLTDNVTGNTYRNLEIRNAVTGITNAGTNHTYSTLFDRCFVHANGTGIQWGGFGQNTIFRDCLINSNTAAQVICGLAGTASAGPVIFRGCEIEFGRATPVTNVQLLNNVLTVFDECYFEQDLSGAFDILIENSSQAANHLVVKDSYFNGNSATATSIGISAGVSSTILHSLGNHHLGYTNAVLDSGTSSQVRRTMCNENGTFVLDTYNGTAITWP